MFWSKIWLFLISIGIAAAATVVLVLPRPAARRLATENAKKVVEACAVTNILMTENARTRIDLAGVFSRADGISTILSEAANRPITPERNRTARDAAARLLASTSGAKPDIVIFTDVAGRVVARSGRDEGEFGDSVAGLFVVDDALRGFLRDDLWIIGRDLFRISASPVVHRSGASPDGYVGAVLLGYQIDNEFAGGIAKQLGAGVSFFANDNMIATSDPVQISLSTVSAFQEQAAGGHKAGRTCKTFEPITVDAGGETFNVLFSRLPGEAGVQGAFFAVFIKSDTGDGLLASLANVRKEDLGFGAFPWIPVAGGTLLVVLIGLALLFLEHDRPLRRLVADALRLANGEAERLNEVQYRGKFGAVARSVNIHFDKMERESKSVHKELDQLLGGPDGSPTTAAPFAAGGFDAGGASQLPGVAPTGATPTHTPPPPAEFKFGENPLASAPQKDADRFNLDLPGPPGVPASATATPAPGFAPPRRPATPAPARAGTPPPRPLTPPAGIATSNPGGGAAPRPETPITDVEVEYRQIFNDFLALKEQCGESTANLTYEKFSQKLAKTRETLLEKHDCKSVKFQTYIKNGKAALKATPVKPT